METTRQTLRQLGKRIRQLRLSKGWSQEFCAQEANLSPTYLSGIEGGLRNPTVKNLVRIAKALGTKLSMLFEDGPIMEGIPVLIVEDDPTLRNVYQRQLERLGYQTYTAQNGAEALEVFLKRPCKLALMDVAMPVMNGIEAVAEIRKVEKHEKKARMPIIAITAFPDKSKECLEAGMDAVMIKPCMKNDFKSLIEQWAPPCNCCT